MYDIQFERASGKSHLSRFALLFPPFKLGGMASGGSRGEFKVEKGIEKTAVAHDSLGVFWRHFQEARLPAHNFSDVVGDGLRDADAVELADVTMSRFDERIGVRQALGLHNLRCDPFVVFAEDQSEEQCRIDVEAGGAPAVDLRETFPEPVGFALAVGSVEPCAELGKEVFKDTEFAAEGEYPFGFSAAEEFLNLFVQA